MKCPIPGWAAMALTRAPFLLVLALFIADSAHTTQQTVAQDAGTVSLHDNFFDPTTIDVTAGTTVVWDNAGLGQHTVVSDDGLFDSGQDKSQWLNPGQTFSFTLTQAGTYPYHCALHGAAGGVGMSGTIVVENPTQVPATAAPQTAPPPTIAPTQSAPPPTVAPTPSASAQPSQTILASATIHVTPTTRSASNVVTPTSPKTPVATSPDPSGGGNDIVWIVLGAGLAAIALGAAGTVIYLKRKHRT
jgi:plastocyanin